VTRIDLWNDNSNNDHSPYPYKPIDNIVKHSPHFVSYIHPYRFTLAEIFLILQRDTTSSTAAKSQAPLCLSQSFGTLKGAGHHPIYFPDIASSPKHVVCPDRSSSQRGKAKRNPAANRQSPEHSGRKIQTTQRHRPSSRSLYYLRRQLTQHGLHQTRIPE